MTGGELTAQWTNDQYFINAGYTYIKTEDTEKNTELLRRPRQSVTAQQAYKMQIMV